MDLVTKAMYSKTKHVINLKTDLMLTDVRDLIVTHSDIQVFFLIRNISLMLWNLKVQPISNYSLGWPYRSISKLGHNDLLKDLAARV